MRSVGGNLKKPPRSHSSHENQQETGTSFTKQARSFTEYRTLQKLDKAMGVTCWLQ